MKQTNFRRKLALSAAAVLSTVTISSVAAGNVEAAGPIIPGCGKVETFCMFTSAKPTDTQTKATYTKIARGRSPHTVQNKFTKRTAMLIQQWDLFPPQTVPPGGKNAPKVRVKGTIGAVRLSGVGRLTERP